LSRELIRTQLRSSWRSRRRRPPLQRGSCRPAAGRAWRAAHVAPAARC